MWIRSDERVYRDFARGCSLTDAEEQEVPYNPAVMTTVTQGALVGLQCFVVLFVALHNWIPLGMLNDVKGAHAAFPGSKLLVTTLINFAPFAFGLAASAFHFGRRYPEWLVWWLWITYLLACYGSLKAWWVPYLFRPDPELAARYKVMYGTTHAFLPERNASRRTRCM
jgi:hypothetical protein